MLKLLITDRLFKCQLRYVINNYILLANIGYLHFSPGFNFFFGQYNFYIISITNIKI